MKYTVVIRQAVADSQRPALEQQLMERFGLNGEQAQRLSARRSGRLMKPTHRARAELLLSVYSQVGADVTLEEVPEATGMLSEPFQSVPRPRGVHTPPMDAIDVQDDAPLAPLNAQASDSPLTPFQSPAPSWPDVPDASAARRGLTAMSAAPLPSAGTTSIASITDAGQVAYPSSTAPTSPKRDPERDVPHPDWFPQGPPDRSPSVNLLDQRPSAPAGPAAPVARPGAPVRPAEPSLTAPTTPFPAPTSLGHEPAGGATLTGHTDVWSDFTGSLTTAAEAAPATPAASAPVVTPVMMRALPVEGRAAQARRSSISTQLRLGTLAPLALSSALTLGVLALTLPGLQRQAVMREATTAATSIGLALRGAPAQASSATLDGIVKAAGLGFVRVELPGGKSYLRSPNASQNAALNQQVAEWTRQHPQGGTLSLNGQPYVVSRVTTASAPAGGAPQRVTVGVRGTQLGSSLVRTLALVLGVALLGLVLAAMLAARAARSVVTPLEELVKVADAISLGDLSKPVPVNRNDEIGDLAQALERMRLSLEAAMDRLRRRRRP